MPVFNCVLADFLDDELNKRSETHVVENTLLNMVRLPIKSIPTMLWDLSYNRINVFACSVCVSEFSGVESFSSDR
jgi:hypothetical protein